MRGNRSTIPLFYTDHLKSAMHFRVSLPSRSLKANLNTDRHQLSTPFSYTNQNNHSLLRFVKQISQYTSMFHLFSKFLNQFWQLIVASYLVHIHQPSPCWWLPTNQYLNPYRTSLPDTPYSVSACPAASSVVSHCRSRSRTLAPSANK